MSEKNEEHWCQTNSSRVCRKNSAGNVGFSRGVLGRRKLTFEQMPVLNWIKWLGQTLLMPADGLRRS